MKEREHQIQVECVRWFRLAYPKLRIFAIPNGGQRNAAVAGKMKAEGVTAGVPDLFIPVASNGFHGLWIEMKRSDIGKNGKLINKGTLSDVQKDMMTFLVGQGYAVFVAYCFDDFRGIVKAYFDEKEQK